MGIRDKKPIDADRRNTYIEEEYQSKEKAPITNREVLKKRLFKHSEFERPYDADDYARMQRNYSIPRHVWPSYLPNKPPDGGIPVNKPGDQNNVGIIIPDTNIRSDCDCGVRALILTGIGVIPVDKLFSGKNDCGETFDNEGFSNDNPLCIPENWEISVSPCTGNDCEDFLILTFSASGYAGKIEWFHSGAGGEFTTSQVEGETCFEEAFWRIPIKGLFEGQTCEDNGKPPNIILNVRTTSLNTDGSSCTGQQEITAVLGVDEEDEEGSAGFTIGSREDGCPTPRTSWIFSIDKDGIPLNGEDAFGTGQPWEWSAPSGIIVIPQDALATSVAMTVGTFAGCTMSANARHPCGPAADNLNSCLPVDAGAACRFFRVCASGSASSPNECPPGSGRTPPRIRIICNCTSIQKIEHRAGHSGCLVSSSDGFEEDCGPIPEPVTDEYRACVCRVRNADNRCASTCPDVGIGDCGGGTSEFGTCWNGQRQSGKYNCGIASAGTACSEWEESRIVCEWGAPSEGDSCGL